MAQIEVAPLVEFEFPDGSTWEGPGRLIRRVSPYRGVEVVLQYARSEPGSSWDGWEDHVSENASEAAALVHAATLTACAELVRAAGCQRLRGCGRLPDPTDTNPGPIRRLIEVHEVGCPISLAAAIEARGRT